jgi:hypothetical protein
MNVATLLLCLPFQKSAGIPAWRDHDSNFQNSAYLSHVGTLFCSIFAGFIVYYDCAI